MIPQVLAHYRFPLLACAGLIIFMGVFIGALIWVFRAGSKQVYAKASQLVIESEVRAHCPPSHCQGTCKIKCQEAL